MVTRYIPLDLCHQPTPKVKHFAFLAGIEASVRGTLIAVMPLVVYEALGTAEATSAAYFFAGIVALAWGLMVPWATRYIPRRWMYSGGCLLYPIGITLGSIGSASTTPYSLMCLSTATATTFVCFNAYILDYVDRTELGKNQSTQMVYASAPWSIGPIMGVWLYHWWSPAPFLLAGVFSVGLLITFWILRLGNGKQIRRAKGPAPNPLAYLNRFLSQRRLIAGWIFAVMRSCGWWVYIVYLPIFCIEAGLGDKVGGFALSASNALLLAAPLMLKYVNKTSVRGSVRFAFGTSGALFIIAAFLSPFPLLTVMLCMLASVFLVLLDVVGGLPFLLAVKPSERTEMSAVYSSFRDVAGIMSPGLAWLILLLAPLPSIFTTLGAGLLISYMIAGRLHMRLGATRQRSTNPDTIPTQNAMAHDSK